MSVLMQVPSLDDVAEDPTLAIDLDPVVILALHARALHALTALEAPLLLRATRQPAREAQSDGQLLDARAVAAVLDVSVSWVEKHVRDLPPRRSLCGSPRWLRSDLDRWIHTRPSYGSTS
jgi:predicted DNA-binding transcriptional regulator AlpA